MITGLLTNRNSHGDFIRHALLTSGEHEEPVYIASALFTDHEVLRDIGRRFAGRLALDAEVLREGVVRRGDAVQLVAPRADDAAGFA